MDILYLNANRRKIVGVNDNAYQSVPHDQMHEVKTAAIVNVNPWYFSANYVYGSGLQFSSDLKQESILPYNRLDVALLYKLNTRKLNLETGISIINLLNIKNVGYHGFSNLPDDKTVYSRAIPFTPSLFVNIGI